MLINLDQGTNHDNDILQEHGWKRRCRLRTQRECWFGGPSCTFNESPRQLAIEQSLPTINITIDTSAGAAAAVAAVEAERGRVGVGGSFAWRLSHGGL